MSDVIEITAGEFRRSLLKINRDVGSEKTDEVALYLTGYPEMDKFITDLVAHNRTAIYYKIVPMFAGNRVIDGEGNKLFNIEAFQATMLMLDEAILRSGNPNYLGKETDRSDFPESMAEMDIFQTPAANNIRRMRESNLDEAKRLHAIIRTKPASEVGGFDARRIQERIGIIAFMSGGDSEGKLTEDQVEKYVRDALAPLPTPPRSAPHPRLAARGSRSAPAAP
jgi:hypothetical protein